MLTGRTIIDDPSIYILMHNYKKYRDREGERESTEPTEPKGLLKFVDSRWCIKSAIYTR